MVHGWSGVQGSVVLDDFASLGFSFARFLAWLENDVFACFG